MIDTNSFRFSIDRGGTFTDIYAEVPGEPGFKILKLLSENPQQYPRPGNVEFGRDFCSSENTLGVEFGQLSSLAVSACIIIYYDETIVRRRRKF